MPEADFSTVVGGGAETGIGDSLRSLSNNDGDGYENFSLKVNSRCFKLYRLKECIKVQERKRKLLSCVSVLDKT